MTGSGALTFDAPPGTGTYGLDQLHAVVCPASAVDGDLYVAPEARGLVSSACAAVNGTIGFDVRGSGSAPSFVASMTFASTEDDGPSLGGSMELSLTEVSQNETCGGMAFQDE